MKDLIYFAAAIHKIKKKRKEDARSRDRKKYGDVTLSRQLNRTSTVTNVFLASDRVDKNLRNEESTELSHGLSCRKRSFFAASLPEQL